MITTSVLPAGIYLALAAQRLILIQLRQRRTEGAISDLWLAGLDIDSVCLSANDGEFRAPSRLECLAMISACFLHSQTVLDITFRLPFEGTVDLVHTVLW